MEKRDVAIIGAGPGGISAALALGDLGVRALVIEQSDRIAASWRGRYDRLRLNTGRRFSHLPDRRFPKGTPKFPSRDQLIEHLEGHAHEAAVEFRLATAVERIDRVDGGWALRLARGDLQAPQVVVATGHERRPVIPEWPDSESFGGRLLHASEYRNPQPFERASALVVGPGCSGMEIAYDLVAGGASKVWLSVRTPPNIILREGPAGLPADAIGRALLRLPVRVADAIDRLGRRMDLGDLSDYGLPVPDEGFAARYRSSGTVPSLVDREVIDAVKDGSIEVVQAVEALGAGGVRLADGTALEPDAVICATGYRPGLEPLVGHLGVLDEDGEPRSQGREAPAPGLRFIGYTTRPGVLGYTSKQAKAAARAIRRELDSGGRREPPQADASDATKLSSSSPA